MADNEGEPTSAAEEQPTGEATEVAPQEGEAAPEQAAEEPAVEETAAAEQPSSEEAAEKPEEAEPSDEPAEAPPTEAADAEAEPVAATEEGEAPPAAEGEGEGQAEAPAEGEAVEGGATAEGEEAGGEGEQKEGDAEGEGEAQAVEGAEGEERPEGEGGEGEPLAEGEAEAAEGEEKPEGEEKSEEEGEAVEGEEKPEGEEGEEVGARSPVPQSDTFAEGEAPEEDATLVGEKLSREPTPILQLEGSDVPDRLDAGTPDKDDEYRAVPHEIPEEEEEEEEEEPMYDREALIKKYHNALADRETLLQQNYQLQHKLADYFRKKKNDERQDYDKNVTDQEQRYLKYMAQLDELHQQDYAERDSYQQQMEELKARCEDRRHRVDEERQRFVEFKKQVAINAINSRSGKPIAPKDIEQYLVTENKKETEVVNVRLENIKLKNKLKKKEQQLKSKEELAEGLHLIDFEQLKIENQTYNEKIEERNEELLKLRKKITSTVQVLTHLKEKLQFVQGENQIQKGSLQEVEAEVAQKRDILSRTKQARDLLRIDNQRLRQNCGLLGNESLLRDFEERKDEGDELKAKLERLKMQHAELTLNCNQVRRKIEQARVTQQ